MAFGEPPYGQGGPGTVFKAFLSLGAAASRFGAGHYFSPEYYASFSKRAAKLASKFPAGSVRTIRPLPLGPRITVIGTGPPVAGGHRPPLQPPPSPRPGAGAPAPPPSPPPGGGGTPPFYPPVPTGPPSGGAPPRLPGGPGYGDAPWGNQRGGTFDPSRLPTAIRGVFSAIAAIANKYFAAAWLLGEAWRVIGEYNAAVAMDEAEKAAAAKEKLRDLERKAREIERQEKQRIRDEMRESRADARNRERIAAEDRRESARAAREAERERRELAKAERAAFEETLKIEFPKIEKRVYKPPPPPVKTRPWYIQNFPLLVQGLEFAKQRRSTQLGITNILPGQQFAPPQPAVTPTVLTAFGSGGVPSSPSQGTQVCYIRKPRPKRRRAKKTRRICYERAI